MERVIRKQELKESQRSRTKDLWEDFCKLEKFASTRREKSPRSRKELHPILKNKTSTESIRTLSETEIDSLISRSNKHQKRLCDEVQLIKKNFEADDIQKGDRTPLISANNSPRFKISERTLTREESDSILELGSNSHRSKTSDKILVEKDNDLNFNLGSISVKSDNLSEIFMSHRSASNRSQLDEIHMYKLVIKDSNSSISENKTNQSTTRSVPTVRRNKLKKSRTVKSAKVENNPSKYKLLSAKEHLEMQRIFGMDQLMKRTYNTEKSRSYSPDLEQIESQLNINDIENVSVFVTFF